jgi:hypothetical protein
MKGRTMSVFLLLLALVCLLTAPSAATEYHFLTVDVPFANTSNTVVTGLNDQGVSVGTYAQAGGLLNGFVLPRPRGLVTVPLPLLQPAAITNTTIIVGTTGAPRQGFVLNDGTYLPFRVEEPPFVPLQGGILALLTEPLAANDAGLTVGDFRSGRDPDQFKGFVFDPQTFTFEIVTIPGLTSIRLSAINNLDQLAAVGFDDAGQTRSALGDRATQVFTAFVVPDLDDPLIEIAGLTDDGVVAVNVGSVGVVVHDGMAQVITFPGAVATDLQGIRNDLTVYGAYQDADRVTHGFIAVPDGTRIVPRMRSAGLGRAFTRADCYPGCKRLVCRQ